MVVSEKHRYVFVELPRTGSTAIANELCEQYAGFRTLYKHATYEEFRKFAPEEQHSYFVFSCIRNPLDDVVSIYAKYAQDRRNLYRDSDKLRKQSRNILERMRDNRRMHFIERNNADFAAFFRKFYRFPYSRWSDLSHANFDYLIRFEQLQADFADALQHIGIIPKRALPERNRTQGKNPDYLSYYTPEIVPRAKRVFGPYMKKWGYRFPESWGDSEPSWLNQLEYALSCKLKGVYWKRVRPQLAKMRPMVLPSL